MGRRPCCDKSKVKRGPWSPEEDSILKTYLYSHGTGGNWIALPNKAGLKRCGKSCRLRWMNYLRPDIKHGGFTEEEDNIILNLYLSIGSRWSIIASKLPGRTDNDVKNYWNTKMKKKLVEAQRGNNYNFSGINNSTISPKIEEFNDYENNEYPVMNNSVSSTSFSGSTEMSSRSEVSGSIDPYSIISWLMDEEVKEEGTSTTLTSSYNTVTSSQEYSSDISPSLSLENNDYASWYGVDMGVAYDDQGELGFLHGFDFLTESGIEGNSNYSRNNIEAQGLY